MSTGWLECDLMLRFVSWLVNPCLENTGLRTSHQRFAVVVETCDCREMCVARGAPSRRRELGSGGCIAESWNAAQRRTMSAEVTSLSCMGDRRPTARRRRKMERESALRENGVENAVVGQGWAGRRRGRRALRVVRLPGLSRRRGDAQGNRPQLAN
ncbi:hypothetical protein C8R45DRAFT_1042040, partial [Mycena sanguinolenta]